MFDRKLFMQHTNRNPINEQEDPTEQPGYDPPLSDPPQFVGPPTPMQHMTDPGFKPRKPFRKHRNWGERGPIAKGRANQPVPGENIGIAHRTPTTASTSTRASAGERHLPKDPPASYHSNKRYRGQKYIEDMPVGPIKEVSGFGGDLMNQRRGTSQQRPAQQRPAQQAASQQNPFYAGLDTAMQGMRQIRSLMRGEVPQQAQQPAPGSPGFVGPTRPKQPAPGEPGFVGPTRPPKKSTQSADDYLAGQGYKPEDLKTKPGSPKPGVGKRPMPSPKPKPGKPGVGKRPMPGKPGLPVPLPGRPGGPGRYPRPLPAPTPYPGFPGRPPQIGPGGPRPLPAPTPYPGFPGKPPGGKMPILPRPMPWRPDIFPGPRKPGKIEDPRLDRPGRVRLRDNWGRPVGGTEKEFDPRAYQMNPLMVKLRPGLRRMY